RRARRQARLRGARGRPAGRRARPRRGDGRTRAIPRVRPRLCSKGARVPRWAPAPGGARSLDPSRRRSRFLTVAVVDDRLSTLEPIREKVEAGERLDFDDGVALLESDDLLALGELADLA